MGQVPKPCIDCGRLAQGTRCPRCESIKQAKRNADPKRKAYQDPVYRSQPKFGICWICKKPGADTRDHVVPLSQGGTNEPSNIKPAHRSCNSARGRG